MQKNIIKIGKACLAATMLSSTLLPMTTLANEEETPIVMAEESNQSALDQSTKFAPGYSDTYTAEELRTELGERIASVEKLWSENGGYNYYKKNDAIKTAIEIHLPKAKNYYDEGLSTAQTYSWRCKELKDAMKALENPNNIAGENAKEIYRLNNEMETMNQLEYTKESWNAYKKACDDAVSKANSYDDDTLVPYITAILEAKEKLVKIDKNLTALKTLVKDSEDIVKNQHNSNTCVNYRADTYKTFVNCLENARNEIRKGSTTIYETTFNTLYTQLKTAKDGLIVLDAPIEGTESGLNTMWQNDSYETSNTARGGELYISNEVWNDDGTVTVTVTWKNSGINPVTGGLFWNRSTDAYRFWGNKEYSLRPFIEKDLTDPRHKTYLNVFIYDHEGNSITDGSEDPYLTNEEVLNGFTKDFTIPAGSSISLAIEQTNQSHITTQSLGIYYTRSKPLDTQAPIISGIENIEILEGETFDPLKGVSATDNIDGDLTKSIAFSGTIGTKPGKYTLTYSVTDSSGNTTTVDRIITVKAKEVKPETKPTEKPKDEAKKNDVKTSTKTNATALVSLLTLSLLGFYQAFKKRK